jgi:hypothetical protein
LSHVEQWLEAKFCDETGTIPKNEQKSLMLMAYSSSADQSTPVGRVQTITVSGHFKMHHLWSLQSAPPLTGVFLGFLGSFWQGVFLFP